MIRDDFLEKALPLLDDYVGASLGVDSLKSIDGGCRIQVWKVIRESIRHSDNFIDVEITDARSIFNAVTSGKITVKHGAMLLDMYLKLKN